MLSVRHFFRRFCFVMSAVALSLGLSQDEGHAQVYKITAYGKYYSNPNLIVDGRLAKEGSAWNEKDSVFWVGEKTYFIIDLGSLRRINGITVQVDNNDDYRIEYSTDGRQYRLLTQIKRRDGEIEFGLDTLSSIPGNPEYVKSLGFSPVQARFIRVYATGGDNYHSIAELQISETATGSSPGSPKASAKQQAFDNPRYEGCHLWGYLGGPDQDYANRACSQWCIEVAGCEGGQMNSRSKQPKDHPVAYWDGNWRFSNAAYVVDSCLCRDDAENNN